MSHRDPASALRSVDNLDHLKGTKGVYILYQCLTGLVKVGRTYDIGKRHNNLSPFCSPHILIAFFPTEQYMALEKEFHYANADKLIDREYFEIDPDVAFDWFERIGISCAHQASKEEFIFQAIRANWIKVRIAGDKITLTDYLNVTTGIQHRRGIKRRHK